MEITWQGFVLLPLGLLLFTGFPGGLYKLTIVSIPFTATSLLNTASGVPLSPLQYFGLLFVFRQALSFLVGCGPKRIRWDSIQYLLVAFMLVVVGSMIMPLIIDGALWISTNQLNDLHDEPLRLNSSNIKYPAPVVFGVLLALALISWNDTTEKIRGTIKLYVLSGLFVSLWGWGQFLCNSVLMIEYPYYIFNNAVLETMQGYKSQVEIGGQLYPRISSVTHEASIFAKYLLTVIALVLSAVWLKRPLFGSGRDKTILCLLAGALVITLSSTAYLGLLCTGLATGGLLLWFRLIGWRWFFWGVILAALVLLVYWNYPLFREILDALLFSKRESGSAEERWASNISAWEYFRQYPILGVGWAMVTAHSMVMYLLVNCGVVGFSTFALLNFTLLRRAERRARMLLPAHLHARNGEFAVVAGLIVALTLLLLTGVLTGLEFYLGYFYFIIAMLGASVRAHDPVASGQSTGSRQAASNRAEIGASTA